MSLLPLNIETFNTARGRFRSAFSGFTTGQKFISALSLVGLVLLGYLFMRYESRPNYQPLFTNLQSADSGAVVAQLAASKVPYQLSNGGSTVLVPAAMVDKERVALAEQGLPSSSSVGFATLEKGGFTTSQFIQQVEYQQALEGQLAQTIESIQGVQSAKVSLVVPTQSAFAIGTQPTTTASILVDLAPGFTLSSNQVQAIVHLAASATPNLSASNVTLVDNHGDVLSSSGSGATGDLTTQNKQTIAYDNQMQSSIENLLNRVVGVGNSAVQVHALLNFNQQSTTLTGLQTNAQGQPITAATSQSSSKQTVTGTGTAPTGVIGAGQPPVPSNGNYNSLSTSSNLTNAVGQITQTTKQAPGQVVKTSIAVVLNSNARPKPNQAQVQALISAAAGLSTANGDKLVVSELPFAVPNTKKATALAAAAAKRLLYEHIAEGAALVLLILAMLFLALRASRRPVYREVQVTELPRSASPSQFGNDAIVGNAQPAIAEDSKMGIAADADDMMSQVSTQIGHHPSEVVRLLRSWADERSEDLV